MNHILNVIAGFGSAINAFGTAPKYCRPAVGDRSKDMQKIAADFKVVGRRMDKKIKTVSVENYGSINHRSGSR